jgi:hypothetical protein
MRSREWEEVSRPQKLPPGRWLRPCTGHATQRLSRATQSPHPLPEPAAPESAPRALLSTQGARTDGNVGMGSRPLWSHVSQPTHSLPSTRIPGCWPLPSGAWEPLSEGNQKLIGSRTWEGFGVAQGGREDWFLAVIDLLKN